MNVNILGTRTVRAALALLAASALLAGCGGGGGGDAKAKGKDYLACLMVSSGGVADRSFNQQAWTAMQRVAKQKGIEVKYLAVSGSIDYAQIGEQFVQSGCDLIVGQGFDTAETIQNLAESNPDIKFALTDTVLEKKLPNAVSLHYRIDQASFQAGYLAAGMSKTGVVGVVGNMDIPPVQLYLDGWVKGVRHYNKVHEKKVKALGWNPEKRTGTFVGNFTDTSKAGTLTQSEIDQGADVILPLIGGDQAIRSAGGPAKGYYLVWPDTDGCVANPPVCDLLLTSVLKNIDKSLGDVITETVDDKFPAGTYEGTLKNGGVGVASFRDAKVPSDLRDEMTKLRKQIIAGDVEVG